MRKPVIAAACHRARDHVAVTLGGIEEFVDKTFGNN